jgi:two-component system, NtrC family, response regulator AtoC
VGPATLTQTARMKDRTAERLADLPVIMTESEDDDETALNELGQLLAGDEDTTDASPKSLRQPVAASEAPPSLRLVANLPEGQQSVVIHRGESVIVGRSLPSHVVISDPGLSRQHARFTWPDTHGLWIEDMESSNGTVVNGRAVARCQLRPGDQVQLGGTVVTIGGGEGGPPSVRLASYDQLYLAIEHEIARARSFNRPFALMAVSSRGSSVLQWMGEVRSLLRSVDVAASNGPTTALVLLPECRASDARVVAQRIIAADRGWGLGCAIALFPDSGTSTEALIETANDLLALLTEQRRIVSTAERQREPDGDLIVASTAMKRLLETLRRIAKADIPVLLVGETGTGKELIAREIHRISPRAEGPLRSVNCAAIPQSLIESTLFGHEKGAFTGATATAEGLFEQASSGTLLLDEVGELSLPTQAALLRVLETRTINRVGGKKEISVDVRLVAATHRDLDAMAERGEFRSDLLYRLNTVTLDLPPLRARTEEIEPLARHFLERCSRAHHVPLKDLAPDALAVLLRYRWPGNVRELRNVIDRALVICEGDRITVHDLPERLRIERRSQPPRLSPPPPRPSSHSTRPSSRPPVAPTVGTSSDADFKSRVREYEIALMVDAVRRCGGNKTRAARALRMPLRTFTHKWQAYNLDGRFENPFGEESPTAAAGARSESDKGRE